MVPTEKFISLWGSCRTTSGQPWTTEASSEAGAGHLGGECMFNAHATSADWGLPSFTNQEDRGSHGRYSGLLNRRNIFGSPKEQPWHQPADSLELWEEEMMCLPVEREKRGGNYTHSCGSPTALFGLGLPRLFFIYPLPIFLVNQVYASNGRGCIELWFPARFSLVRWPWEGHVKYTSGRTFAECNLNWEPTRSFLGLNFSVGICGVCK